MAEPYAKDKFYKLSAWLLAALFFCVHLWLQIAKWQSLHPACFDYSNVQDVLNSLLDGNVFGMVPTHLYGLVFSQTYYLYLLFYAIAPSPFTLMVINSIIFAAGVLLMYYAGRAVFSRPWPALLFAISLALNPFYDVSSLSGFRPAALIVPATIGAFIAWKKSRRGWFIFSLVLMCTAQLNILFGIFCLGLALWLRDRKAFFGGSTVAISVLWIAMSIGAAALVARWSGVQPPSEIGHFAAFGKSFDEILHTFISRPRYVLENFFYWKNTALLLLLAAVVGLPLLRPTWLAGAIPETVYIMLSTFGHTTMDPRTNWAVNLNDSWFSFFNTGFITLLPFCYLAALEGAQRLRDWLKRKKLFPHELGVSAAVVFVVLTLGLHLFFTPANYGPVPLSRYGSLKTLTQQKHQQQVHDILERVDRDRFYLMDYSFYFFTADIPHSRLLNDQTAVDDEYDYILLNNVDRSPVLTDEQRQAFLSALAAHPYTIAWKSETGAVVILARQGLPSPFCE